MRKLNETKFEGTRPNESYLDVSSAEDLAENLAKVERFHKIQRTVTVESALSGEDVNLLYDLAEGGNLDNVEELLVNPLQLSYDEFENLLNLETILPDQCKLSFVGSENNRLIRDEVIGYMFQKDYIPIDEREDY